jgi:hypothetical protein
MCRALGIGCIASLALETPFRKSAVGCSYKLGITLMRISLMIHAFVFIRCLSASGRPRCF